MEKDKDGNEVNGALEWLFDVQLQEQLELMGKSNGIVTRQKQVKTDQPAAWLISTGKHCILANAVAQSCRCA